MGVQVEKKVRLENGETYSYFSHTTLSINNPSHHPVPVVRNVDQQPREIHAGQVELISSSVKKARPK
ncbi:MAG TPA: hypothetical protein VJQ25_08295 [Nitrospira sp.]|jgi:hypothetical protein|nr:hypothetical protein [Nitrospira sp.]